MAFARRLNPGRVDGSGRSMTASRGTHSISGAVPGRFVVAAAQEIFQRWATACPECLTGGRELGERLRRSRSWLR